MNAICTSKQHAQRKNGAPATYNFYLYLVESFVEPFVGGDAASGEEELYICQVGIGGGRVAEESASLDKLRKY